MSQATAVADGIHCLTPHLVCQDAVNAIDFYANAFDAKEIMRLQNPADGKLMHAMLRIGDCTLMLADEFPDWGSFSPKTLKGTPVTLHLYVPDVDAALARAVSAGAKLIMPASDMFWGDRHGQVEDPFGHRWSMATHLRDMTVEEIQQAMAKAEPCGGASQG